MYFAGQGDKQCFCFVVLKPNALMSVSGGDLGGCRHRHLTSAAFWAYGLLNRFVVC